MITCEMKQPGALVKDVRKIPLEYSNLSASVAAQGTCCQHKAAHSCKIWRSSGKAWTICLSFWHLLLSVLSSFNKNKACFACQASWLILVTALVKHKELLDKKELQLKPLKNVNRTRSLQVQCGIWSLTVFGNYPEHSSQQEFSGTNTPFPLCISVLIYFATTERVCFFKKSDRYKTRLIRIALEKEIFFPESTFRFAAISRGLVS